MLLFFILTPNNKPLLSQHLHFPRITCFPSHQCTDIILNLIVTVSMKKAPSKSVFSKKNKTISNIPQSKKNSRIVKANSCVKINSLNSEQNSRQPLSQTISKQNNSQKMILPYQLSQLSQPEKGHHSQRQSYRVEGKCSVQTIPMREVRQESREDNSVQRLKQKNEEITKENLMLKQKCCDLQEISLKDKEKIKNLIIRINEVKQNSAQTTEMKRTQPSNAQLIFNQHEISVGKLPSRIKLQTPYKAIASGPCENKECLQRKKYLESQLYRERILRDKLQSQKRQWQHNKQQLKQQYSELLLEIQDMRDHQY